MRAAATTVTPAGEQRAFESLIDLVMDRLAADSAKGNETELFADYERFRQEELNKLNDLSASYNLLRDRVHETELATARRVDQIAQDTRSAVDASRVEVGSLGARLDNSLEALATEVRAELSAQAAESAAIRVRPT